MAVLFLGGQRSSTVAKRLGDEGQISVVDAEVVAIWMAAHLVIHAVEVIQAVIYLDSQLEIGALEGELVGASPSLVATASLAIRNTCCRAGNAQV